MAPKYDPDTTCLHLRSKQMFYEEPTASVDDEAVDDFIDTTQYWCQCTQTGRGPDAEPVNRSLCRFGRKCFENISSIA